MRYQGSKAKIAKFIQPIVLAKRLPGQPYVEPFMGGCNSLDKVANPRIANDTNGYLVAMFRALTEGWIPPETVASRATFDLVRNDPDLFEPEFVAFTRYSCGYGGQWEGSYYPRLDSAGRDYAAETRRSLLRQAPKLRGADFRSGSYATLELPRGCLIYCDPPYAGTHGYADGDAFDSIAFWEWVRIMVDCGGIRYSLANTPLPLILYVSGQWSIGTA